MPETMAVHIPSLRIRRAIYGARLLRSISCDGVANTIAPETMAAVLNLRYTPCVPMGACSNIRLCLVRGLSMVCKNQMGPDG